MSRRARPSGITVGAADVALIKGMLLRGDRQHDIAAWFGVNGGRIAEIAVGQKFKDVKAALPLDLPPQGPYQKIIYANDAIASLSAVKDALAAAEVVVGRLIQR